MEEEMNTLNHGVCFDVPSVRGEREEFSLRDYGGCLKDMGGSRLV
jgi:hypothetical protein